MGNIFENDQIGSFSFLVIITLMSNRLNKVEKVLHWKVHFGNKGKSQFYLDYALVVHAMTTHQFRCTWKLGWKIKNLFEILQNTVLPPVISLSPISESIFHSLLKSGQWRKMICCMQSYVIRIPASLWLPVHFFLFYLYSSPDNKILELLSHMKGKKKPVKYYWVLIYFSIWRKTVHPICNNI